MSHPLQVDYLATGHYARLSGTNTGEQGDSEMPSLLRGIDNNKDQTYFLSM